MATQHLKQQTWFQTVTKKKNLKWVTEGEKWNAEYDYEVWHTDNKHRTWALVDQPKGGEKSVRSVF